MMQPQRALPIGFWRELQYVVERQVIPQEKYNKYLKKNFPHGITLDGSLLLYPEDREP